MILCAQLTGQSWINAVLAAGTYTFAGLSAAWYFVGTNRPIPLFLLDATPSIVGQVLGLVAVLITGDLTAYLACTAALTAVGVAASMVYVVTRPQDGPRRAARPTPWREILRSQSAGVSSTISASMWTAAPTVLVQAFAPAAVPVFAMIDRLMKYGVLALAPILQAIQGWVPESGRATVGARAVTGVKVATESASSGRGFGGIVDPGVVAAEPGRSRGAVDGRRHRRRRLRLRMRGSDRRSLGPRRARRLSPVGALVDRVRGGRIPVIAALVIWLGLYGAILGILIVAAALAVYRAVHVRRYARRYV